MCGRFTNMMTWKKLHETYSAFLDEMQPTPNWPARYNIAPTQVVPVVRLRDGRRRIEFLRWGLIPIWAKDAKIGAQCVNAQGETAHSKPAFRAAFAARRCIVPADGWYEWTGDKKAKQPWYFTLSQPFGFAGLWETWTAKHDEGKPTAESRIEAGKTYETFAIVTSAPSAKVAEIHDREPVALLPDQFAAWLDPAASVGSLRAMLKPADDALVSYRKVSPLVNAVKNDGPELVI
jgi:putative SOS response-associated peptidase YedK